MKLFLRLLVAVGAAALLICRLTIDTYTRTVPDGVAISVETWGSYETSDSGVEHVAIYGLVLVLLLSAVSALVGAVGWLRRRVRATWLRRADAFVGVLTLVVVGLQVLALRDARDDGDWAFFDYEGNASGVRTLVMTGNLATVVAVASALTVSAALNALLRDHSIDPPPPVRAPRESRALTRSSQVAGGPGHRVLPTGPVGNHPRAVPAFLLGFFGASLCLFFLAPFGWWLGARTVREIDANPGAYHGRGWAMAGMVLGIVGVVLSVLSIIAVGALAIIVIASS